MDTRICVFSFVYLFLFGVADAQDKSMPHGDNFNLDCALCHSTDDWRVDAEKTIFDHDQTGYPLTGEHAFADCRSCHESLIFNRIGHACADCHTDVHAGELGIRCERCHSPVDWDNRLDIFKLHENSLFPLVGVHAVLDCRACHTKESYNEFAGVGVECKTCHLSDYMSTLNPAH
ncbi:MAG: cytochrome c3 family protein, partial [Calditrichaceae bacterium]